MIRNTSNKKLYQALGIEAKRYANLRNRYNSFWRFTELLKSGLLDIIDYDSLLEMLKELMLHERQGYILSTLDNMIDNNMNFALINKMNKLFNKRLIYTLPERFKK